MEKINAICSDIISYNRPAYTKESLKFLYSVIDLTNLNSYATNKDIDELCLLAQKAEVESTIIPSVAAVCVYPIYISRCKETLKESSVRIATVSGTFPHAQTYSEVKYLETELAVAHGADEIDVVVNLSALFNNNASLAFDEIKTIKQICGNRHLKVILETNLLKEPNLISEASNLAMEAGADFVKTSTGKEGSVANYVDSYLICKAIQSHYNSTGKKIGIKPAGGIATTEEAFNYMAIVKEVLGKEWLTPDLFRIGASRLANNLIEAIKSVHSKE